MCGIFGYVGTKNNAGNILQEGLQRLSYRGYDSWGIGVIAESKISVEKAIGKVPEKKIKFPLSRYGLGHTRWATHGGVTQANAHPHMATDKSFVLVQNGIFENYLVYKKTLEADYIFYSETDTEVLLRLIEQERDKADNLFEAVRQVLPHIKGRNTFAIMTEAGEFIAARNGSPLVVGATTSESEVYFSSDTLSFAPYVDKICVIENGQIVHYKAGVLKLYSAATGDELPLKFTKNNLVQSKIDKEGYPHYMLKEIFEQPTCITQIAVSDVGAINELTQVIRTSKHVYTIGSGTTGLAAAQFAYYLRTIGKIHATSLIGAGAQSYQDLFEEGDLIIAPSQSGETADVLEVIEYAKQRGVKIASCVNMPGSMLTRISDYPFMVQAGPEICVCSTKVFTAHLAWGYLLAKAVARQTEEGIRNLERLATTMQTVLDNSAMNQQVQKIAKDLSVKEHIFLLAKEQNLQIAGEGMVKIIEQSYRHAHAIPAGDLKHYAITLMEPGVPVIVLLSEDGVKHDVLNALHQIQARGADTMAIAPSMQEGSVTILVPDAGEVSAILNIIPLQLLAYYMGVALGNDIDKPRNIAKSVTVK